MRLLVDQGHDNLGLVEHYDNDIPRYAILSHTWGADTEEVTFKDLMEGTGKNKAGYEKLRFCRKQAASDDLQYFWVDTCCIDKSSTTEVFEAINSMFHWYGEAVKCYVYLSDVWYLGTQQTISYPQPYGNRLSGEVHGLSEAGLYKSFLLQHRSNSFHEKASN